MKRIYKDSYGNAQFIALHEGTENEEIVDVQTNKSNQTIHTMRTVLDVPSHCPHNFRLYNVAKREVECIHCHYTMTCIFGINFEETAGAMFVTLQNTKYPVFYEHSSSF